MTSTTPLISGDDVARIAAALAEWPNSEIIYDDFTLAVSPFTTIYFRYDPARHVEASLDLVDVFEDYEALLDSPFKFATHPLSERPYPYNSKRLGDRRTYAKQSQLAKSFLFSATDEANHLSSPSTAAYIWRCSTWNSAEGNNHYSYIQLYYRWQWWIENSDAWRAFLLRAIDRLRADQAYSGFSLANPLDIASRYEVAVWERALAPVFLGLDIDFPFSMARTLMQGVRPCTWGFLLSDSWRSKLGLPRTEFKQQLATVNVHATEVESGLWLEAFDSPRLLPIEHEVPESLLVINRLLRPIRNDDLGLVGFGQWDGDPNERFTGEESRRWLARFDDHSDWAPSDARRAMSVPTLPSAIVAGERCPRGGFWFTPAATESRRRFALGEIMPTLGGDYGATVWQWDAIQAD